MSLKFIFIKFYLYLNYYFREVLSQLFFRFKPEAMSIQKSDNHPASNTDKKPLVENVTTSVPKLPSSPKARPSRLIGSVLYLNFIKKNVVGKPKVTNVYPN